LRPLSRLDGIAVDVIQSPKPEPLTIRYELSDYEWTAIKPMLPDKPLGVRRIGCVPTSPRPSSNVVLNP